MPIEMPKGLPFSVDTWTPSSSKRHCFLTHAHKDHSSSITCHSSFLIYSTNLLQQYPQLDASLFLDIEVGQSLIIDDPAAGAFTVSAFDANHCPGNIHFSNLFGIFVFWFNYVCVCFDSRWVIHNHVEITATVILDKCSHVWFHREELIPDLNLILNWGKFI